MNNDSLIQDKVLKNSTMRFVDTVNCGNCKVGWKQRHGFCEMDSGLTKGRSARLTMVLPSAHNNQRPEEHKVPRSLILKQY